MSALLSEPAKNQLSTVQDLVVLVLANFKRFLVVSVVTLTFFVAYAYLQTPYYRYSAVIKLPEKIDEKKTSQIINGMSFIEYVNNVTLSTLEFTPLERKYLKRLKITSPMNSNIVVFSVTGSQNDIIKPLVDGIVAAGLKYLDSETEIVRNTVIKERESLKLNSSELASSEQFSLLQKRALLEAKLQSINEPQILSATQRSQNPLNMSAGAIIAMGCIFSIIAGIIGVLICAFSENIRIRVRQSKMAH